MSGERLSCVIAYVEITQGEHQQQEIHTHRIKPSMLQQSEVNSGLFHKPEDSNPVLYKLSNLANGLEDYFPAAC